MPPARKASRNCSSLARRALSARRPADASRRTVRTATVHPAAAAAAIVATSGHSTAGDSHPAAPAARTPRATNIAAAGTRVGHWTAAARKRRTGIVGRDALTGWGPEAKAGG